jgi:hypothetical protein
MFLKIMNSPGQYLAESQTQTLFSCFPIKNQRSKIKNQRSPACWRPRSCFSYNTGHGVSMNRRNKAARILVTIGSVVLFAAGVLHFFAGYSAGFPALAASNLQVGLQTAFRVVFLSLGWDWILFGTIALVAAFKATAARRALVLVCGLGVLIEAAVGAGMMGIFIGNEMIGAAAILIVIGGLLFENA